MRLWSCDQLDNYIIKYLYWQVLISFCYGGVFKVLFLLVLIFIRLIHLLTLRRPADIPAVPIVSQ